jgi:RNA-directed DNA polymerase
LDDAALCAAFSTLKTVDDVARLLEVKPAELRYYLFKAKQYKSFTITKRSGGTRVIHSPSNALKIIQRKLAQVLLAVYKGRAPVHGFVRDRSIRSNARRHLGCQTLLNFDLADFFPSINFGRIRGLFAGKPYALPEPVALVLSQICSYQKALPAGAPTSPVVANMICAKMDSELKCLALRHKCLYTRYADDITFSIRDDERLPGPIAYHDGTSGRWAVGQQVADTVKNNGFLINDSKTRVERKGSRQEVTGVLINERLNVKRRFVRQVRAMLHAWEKYTEDAAEAEFRKKYDNKQRSKPDPEFRRVLRGKLEFLGFIRGTDDSLFLKLRERYAALAPDETFRTITLGRGADSEVLAQAVWLLQGENDSPQGTAFAAEGFGLLTAAHAVEEKMWASLPHVASKRYPVKVVRKNEHYDVAQVEVDCRRPVQLAIGPAQDLHPGAAIKLLGFPNYHVGDRVNIQQGQVVQKRVFSLVTHFVVGQAIIVKGASGGPVLDENNRVVGIAVKGVGDPGHFTEHDEISSFVPISALQRLEPV